MPSLAQTIAGRKEPGFVTAPAGYGKTHLIAESVSLSARRQLILTHTYAGVNAIRKKLQEFRVSNRLFRVETIASWALRISRSFRSTSGWGTDRPADDQWASLYDAAVALLGHAFMERILRASYEGVYIDEYQDCSMEQHRLILAIAGILPVRLVGDPMQAIFDFEGEAVDWERDVQGNFNCLGILDTPHRWIRAGRPKLGNWLRDVRIQLASGESVSLVEGVPYPDVRVAFAVTPAALAKAQANVCRYLKCSMHETAVAIFGGGPSAKARSHSLARRTSGRFSSIEEIEGRSLFSAIGKLEASRTNKQRLKTLVAFAEACLTNVKRNLPTATSRGEFARIGAGTRNTEIAKAANSYLEDATSSNALRLLNRIRDAHDVAGARLDLFIRMTGVLRKHAVNPRMSLADAAETYHSEFRRSGRTIGRRIAGTTLLVKGLQFDHSIVMDVSTLSRREAYVALTRGARSVSIVSSSDVLSWF